jgi:DNA polymerase-3 subunit delta
MAKGESYLFLGPEIGEKKEAVLQIKAGLEKRYTTAPEETVLYVGETAVNVIVSALLNLPLFAQTRLFRVKNIGAIKKDGAKLIAAYVKEPADDTFLILEGDETKADSELENAAGIQKRVFWEMFEDRKAAWVINYFKRNGFSARQEAALDILELVENNTDALAQACSSIMLLCAGEKLIDSALVEKYLTHNREESAFTLFASLAEGNFPHSAEILHSLTAGGVEAPALFAGLLWCFRRLRDYHKLKERNAVTDFEMRKIGLANPRSKKDYLQAASRCDAASCDMVITLCAEFDCRIRADGNQAAGILLDLFLYKVWRLFKLKA